MINPNKIPKNNEELAICLTDPMWRLSNLYWIVAKEEGGDGDLKTVFKPNGTQQSIIRDLHYRNVIPKARQLGVCVAQDSLIMLESGDCVRAGDLKSGDYVVACDEMGQRRWRAGSVQAVDTTTIPSFRLRFDSGRDVVCSGDHPWLCRNEAGELAWASVSGYGNRVVQALAMGDDVACVGRKEGAGGSAVRAKGRGFSYMLPPIHFLHMLPPIHFLQLPQLKYFSKYFPNFPNFPNFLQFLSETLLFCKKRLWYIWNLNIFRAFFFRTGCVRAEIDESRGISTEPSCQDLSFFQSESNHIPFGQLLSETCSYDRITDIEYVGVKDLVHIQTDCQTFICNGLVSHNTTLSCILGLDYALFRDNFQVGIIAHTDGAAKKLFRDKVLFAYEHLSKVLRDWRTLKKSSAEELVFNNDSSILVSTSMRSGTINFLHVCLSGDTGILCKNGWVKRIADIESGDLVLCGNGGYQAVDRVVKNRLADIGEPLLSLKTHGYYKPLKLTGNHSVLSCEQKTGEPVWKQAKELVEGDYIGYPLKGSCGWFRAGDYYWTIITEIETAKDEEYVYDLVLPDEPHNYVTLNGIVHNSEMGKISARFPDRAKEIITGSLPAVPKQGLVVMESTSEGREGAFYDISMRAKALQDKGSELTIKDWKLHFFPWFLGVEYRISPVGVMITDDDHQYFDRIELECGVELDLEQRAWYCATRDTDFSGDEDLMRQEFPATFDEAFSRSSQGCYYTRQIVMARKTGRYTELPVLPDMPCMSFWDIGRSDGTAVWVVQRLADEFRCIYFYESWFETYSHATQWLQSLGLVWDRMFLPHDADHVRQGKLSNKSPREMLEELMPGVKWETVPRIDSVEWGIQQTRDIFPLLWFDEKRCRNGLEHIESYKRKWNERQGAWSNEPDKAGGHSEAADALRQLAQAYAGGLIHRRREKKKTGKAVRSWRVV